MESVFMKLQRALIKHPWFVILVSATCAIFSTAGLFRMSFTTDISDYFLSDDPALKSQEEYRALFDQHEFIAVLVESKDVFSRKSLETINKLGRRLQKEVPFADSLVSLSSVNPVISGGLSFQFDGDSLVSTDKEIQEIKKKYSQIDSIRGRLFSEDDTQAWVILNLKPFPSREEWGSGQTPQFKAGETAYRIVHEMNNIEGIRLTPSGIPVFAQRKEVEMLGDFMKILLIGAVISILLTSVILRNFQAIVGTLAVIFLSISTIFGFYGWLGRELDNAFMAVPILLTMGLTIGYTVHITHFFSLKFSQTGLKKVSVFYALEETWKPILFTVLTTSAALLTFLLVKIEPIRWVGYTSVLCLSLVYLLSMTLFPLILGLGKDRSIFAPGKRSKVFEAFLALVSRLVRNHQRSLLLLFLLVTVVCIAGVFRVEVDFNGEKMMGLRLPHMIDQKRVSESKIGSSEYMNLTLTMDKKLLMNPVILHKIEEVQKEIETLPLVKRTTSVTLNIREFNRLFNRNDLTSSIPSTPSSLKALYNLFERLSPGLFREWMTDDYRSTRIFIELNTFSSRLIEEDLSKIDDIITTVLPDNVHYFLSGSTYQMALMNQYVTRGLIRSILMGLIIITILMVLVFRNIKLGLVAMIPNLFPILVCGAIMGMARIPLEFVTMTVAPLIMGLAVDDTIHFINHMEKTIRSVGSYPEGISQSFKVVGTAITQTTVILCLTFLVFVSSEVNSMINMGILTFSGMLAAYIADIFITPILINIFKPIQLKNAESARS